MTTLTQYIKGLRRPHVVKEKRELAVLVDGEDKWYVRMPASEMAAISYKARHISENKNRNLLSSVIGALGGLAIVYVGAMTWTRVPILAGMMAPLGGIIGGVSGWWLGYLLQDGPLWAFWRYKGALVPIICQPLADQYEHGSKEKPKGPMVYQDEWLYEMLNRRNLKAWLARMRSRGLQKLQIVLLVWLAIAMTGLLFLLVMAMSNQGGQGG